MDFRDKLAEKTLPGLMDYYLRCLAENDRIRMNNVFNEVVNVRGLNFWEEIVIYLQGQHYKLEKDFEIIPSNK